MSQVRTAFNKASNNYEDHAFLQKEVANRLDKKLNIISSNSAVILDLGAGTGLLSQQLIKALYRFNHHCARLCPKLTQEQFNKSKNLR